jgi:predicted lysophospholipase L1 biosynthesis ABC-type transport system permease subunit
MRETARPADALPEAPLARSSAGMPAGEAARTAARRVVGRRQEARVWTMAGRLPGALTALAALAALAVLAASRSLGPPERPQWPE